MRLLITAWMTGLLAVAVPFPARAQGTFGSELRTTQTLLERRQYEQALKQVQDLQQSSLTAEQSLTVTLYEGCILASMGPRHQPEALAAFRLALLEDPQVRLPLKAPSRIVREFEVIREQIIAEKRKVLLSEGGITSTHVLSPTVAGGGLLTSGAVFWALARRESSRLENADPETTSDEDLRRWASRGKTYQTLGFSLLGAGAASLGIATTLYLRRKSQVSVALSVGMNSTSVVAYGSWQ